VSGHCHVTPALSSSKAICISQLCTGLHRTGVYYTAKLQFPTIFPSKLGVRIIQVCELYSNFYGCTSFQKVGEVTFFRCGEQSHKHIKFLQNSVHQKYHIFDRVTAKIALTFLRQTASNIDKQEVAEQ